MVSEPHLICRRVFPPHGLHATLVIATVFDKESGGQRGYSIILGFAVAEPDTGPGTSDADSVKQCWGCPQPSSCPVFCSQQIPGLTECGCGSKEPFQPGSGPFSVGRTASHLSAENVSGLSESPGEGHSVFSTVGLGCGSGSWAHRASMRHASSLLSSFLFVFLVLLPL